MGSVKAEGIRIWRIRKVPSRQGCNDHGLGESEGRKQMVGHLPRCLWPLVRHHSLSHPVRTEDMRPGQIRTWVQAAEKHV